MGKAESDAFLADWVRLRELAAVRPSLGKWIRFFIGFAFAVGGLA